MVLCLQNLYFGNPVLGHLVMAGNLYKQLGFTQKMLVYEDANETLNYL